MRALWSDRPNCSHNVSQKVKRIRRVSDLLLFSYIFQENPHIKIFRVGPSTGDPQGVSLCLCALLDGPVRDTPPYRAIPFRDSIAEGGIAPICLVFMWYRASIAEIPFLGGGGGYRTSTSNALQGGKRGRGYRTQLAMLRHQKPHSAQ